MAEEDSIQEKMKAKFDDSSSSDSDHEEKMPKKAASPPPASASPDSGSFKSKAKRLFGRQKPPVHKALGGGKPADVFLWRNKKISAGVLGGATVVWVLFEVVECHLLSLICTCLIVALAGLFLWTNAHTLIHKSPPPIPKVHIPEEPVLQFAAALRSEINCGFAVLRDIASGNDLKKFLAVIAFLWILSIVGSWGNFLNLFYFAFVGLHTLPVLYEKYEDQVDAFVEKAMVQIKRQYAVFDAKVLSKIPKGPRKGKKQA